MLYVSKDSLLKSKNNMKYVLTNKKLIVIDI